MRKVPDGGIEYWTHVGYGGYRKAFLRFLEKEHQVLPAEVDCDWQADHLLSRAFARKFGVDYVRMCLLAREQNQGYGRKFERNMLSIQQHPRGIFLLDYQCVMKALGIAIPRNRNDYEARKSAVARELSAKGVDFPDKWGGRVRTRRVLRVGADPVGPTVSAGTGRSFASRTWWLWVDSNHRPQHYECCALTG